MVFSKAVLVAALLAACWGCALSYKILVLVPIYAKSHHNLGRGVADTLHERGHEITFVSCFPSTKSPHREIGLPELLALKGKPFYDIQNGRTVFGLDQTKDDNTVNFEMNNASMYSKMMTLNAMIPRMAEEGLKNKELQKLLNDPTEKFDLVVYDHFKNEVFHAIAVRFNCPLVLLSPTILMHMLARDTGNPVSPATIPNMGLSTTGEMTLMQRIKNTAMAVMTELMDTFIFAPPQEALYKKYFPAEAARLPFSELRTRVAAVLINTHPSMEKPRPLLPNAIEVGGYHIGPIKPLPKDLQEILDNAKNGVIFFSMGSNLKSNLLPTEIREGILRSLAKLKQTVLWKFESDLPGRPDNVIIRDWLPQTAILAHKNVRLFISHGGMLSCIEAAGAGVPLLAIPIFGDQHANAKATQDRGNGLMLQYSNLTEAALTATLNELLTNDRYTKKAREIYRLFNDRPMTPRDLLTFTVEHVIRTGGAPHLTPPKISLFSLLLLDVAAVVLLPPLLVLLAICCYCKRRRCSKAKKEQDKSTQENKKNK